MKQANSIPIRISCGASHSVARRVLPAIWLALLIVLTGCTASWQAPVEARGSKRVPAQTTAVRGPALRGDRYRVRAGDTLFGIAWQRGLDYRSIAAWNEIRPPYRIYAGQVLTLKPPPARQAPSQARKKPSQPPPPPKKKTGPVEKEKAASAKPSEPSPGSAGPRRLSWQWPVKGRVLSSFEPSDPLRKGIRIGSKEGARILAAEGGKVVYSGSGLIGYGRLIIVKHNDKYLSAYGHNRKILVREGDQVAKGQQIAEMGRANDGVSLLHFEIRRDGKPVDPRHLLPRH